ncbi:MAG: amidohydrolase family protein [Anaerolineae bacterium]|nr:amidohydrolase family protein [Anaerolineae bacterium]
MSDRVYSVSGVTLVTPDQVKVEAALTVSGRYIAALEAHAPAFDLHGLLAFPGLINAHDHLNGTWWPRVGPNRPYTNVYEWLADLDGSPVRYDREQNSVEDVYELGMYRNLLSGVTTIADHFFRIDGPEFYTRHPVHVLYQYGRTWTPRELTKWGDDVPSEFGRAARDGQPYIIHLAEGLDLETAAELDVLLRYDALGRNTMIVHGIALRPDDMKQMAQAGASVCWCPESNLYLYGQTANIPALLRAGVNITLGTDSSLTGSLHPLDELRVARRVYREQSGQDPSPQWLVELVTTRAAYALMLQDRRAKIAPGYEADLLLLPDAAPDPYTSLIEAQVDDIALLICRGVPVYGDETYHDLFAQFSPAFSTVSINDRPKLVAGDLAGLIERMSQAVGRELELPFLPCARRVCQG